MKHSEDKQPESKCPDGRVCHDFCTDEDYCARIGVPKIAVWPTRRRVKATSSLAKPDLLSQWQSKPSADEIEAHYPSSQHQPDECEMCRFIHDAAKAYVAASPSVVGTPDYTYKEKRDAFEWLREIACGGELHAVVALAEWHALKSAATPSATERSSVALI